MKRSIICSQIGIFLSDPLFEPNSALIFIPYSVLATTSPVYQAQAQAVLKSLQTYPRIVDICKERFMRKSSNQEQFYVIVQT